MRVLITGGAGFVGSRLAKALLARGHLLGQPITQLVLADQFPAPAELTADPRVQAHTGPLLDQCASLTREPLDGVFHLASAVSGECEDDFDLGLRSNLDSTRALLDALRARTAGGATAPRVVFSSSVAVFGPDDAVPMPEWVDDDTLPTPQTSYGIQKLICEQLVADYTRKGYIDGRSARLMTVTVRPGRPNGAASSFFSGIIREPLAGEASVCPVSPDVTHPVTSPRATVEGLIAVFEASRDAYGGRTAMNLPALNVSVAEMLQALETVAGPAVRARVTFARDERIAGIVARWPKGARATRAARLGLQAESRFEDIVRDYIADCQRDGRAEHALKGMA
jgi:nucleoside-diphosphate-sugar epimerase